MKQIENMTILTGKDLRDKWDNKFAREWKSQNQKAIDKLTVELIAENN